MAGNPHHPRLISRARPSPPPLTLRARTWTTLAGAQVGWNLTALRHSWYFETNIKPFVLPLTASFSILSMLNVSMMWIELALASKKLKKVEDNLKKSKKLVLGLLVVMIVITFGGLALKQENNVTLATSLYSLLIAGLYFFAAKEITQLTGRSSLMTNMIWSTASCVASANMVYFCSSLTFVLTDEAHILRPISLNLGAFSIITSIIYILRYIRVGQSGRRKRLTLGGGAASEKPGTQNPLRTTETGGTTGARAAAAAAEPRGAANGAKQAESLTVHRPRNKGMPSGGSAAPGAGPGSCRKLVAPTRLPPTGHGSRGGASQSQSSSTPAPGSPMDTAAQTGLNLQSDVL